MEREIQPNGFEMANAVIDCPVFRTLVSLIVAKQQEEDRMRKTYRLEKESDRGQIELWKEKYRRMEAHNAGFENSQSA